MHPRVSIFLQTVKAFWMDRHRTKSTAPEPNLLNLKHEPISLKLRIGDWGSIETVTRDYFRLADHPPGILKGLLIGLGRAEAHRERCLRGLESRDRQDDRRYGG